MGRLPKAAVYSVLGAIFLLNLALRFPRSPHEIGLDSFVMHSLTDTLINKGHADWILNPLGYFGLYPFSYPSAGMFYIGSISSVCGIDTEVATFIGPLALSMIAVMSSFMLGRELHHDIRFSLFLSFTLSTAPIFVNYTLWETPTRSLFMALTPLFLWLFLKYHKDERGIHIPLMVVLFVVLLASHRLAAMILLVVMAYVVTFIYIYGAKIAKELKPKYFLLSKYKTMWSVWLFVTVILCGFLMLQANMLFGDALTEYERGVMFEGSGPATAFANLLVSLARSLGILLPLAGLGLFAVIEKPNKDFQEPFIVILFITLVPTLFLRMYTGFYLLPILSILICYGYMFIVEHLDAVSRFVKVGVVAGLLLSTVAFSAFMIGYHFTGTGILNEERYSSALYVRNLDGETVIFNDGAVSSHVNSMAEKRVLPCGGATTPMNAPELLAYDFADPDDMTVEPLPIEDITVQTDYPFIDSGINSLTDYNSFLLYAPEDFDSEKAKAYQPAYVFEVKAYAGTYNTGWSKAYYSRLLVHCAENNYIIYSYDEAQIYTL